MKSISLEKKVHSLLNSYLELRPDLFLINLTLSHDNKINVIIDGDNGVSIQDCLEISRAIENNLDREDEDFALEVSSFGLSENIVLPRQFIKNINREIEITNQQNQKLIAKLVHANNKEIKLVWQERVPKKIGKGKETANKEIIISYKDIKTAKIHINFN